jgi:ribosomal protein S18 acetylase RimI-like enzyme
MVIIKEIDSRRGLENSLKVIRDSFKTVAAEFGLNKDNCPTHPSLITLDKLLELQGKAKLIGLFLDSGQAGFVAVEEADSGVYYLDKLAVLPDHRHKGYGRKLVEFVVSYAKKHGGQKISLGMIDESAVLKEWYKTLGFVETGTKNFEHLPFTVCFMDLNLSPR